MRNKELTLLLLEIRLKKLEAKPINRKCPGVVNRLRSEVASLRKELDI